MIMLDELNAAGSRLWFVLLPAEISTIDIIHEDIHTDRRYIDTWIHTGDQANFLCRAGKAIKGYDSH